MVEVLLEEVRRKYWYVFASRRPECFVLGAPVMPCGYSGIRWVWVVVPQAMLKSRSHPVRIYTLQAPESS
jgi:hypothetical protein